MSVLIVGSTALDSIKTPKSENPRLLGGSASHAAVAASFFSPVKLVGVVGDDFPRRYIQLYRRHGIDLEGLQVQKGKTFHWSGEYETNMNNRRTLLTELGVFETFTPTLPKSYQASKFVLLANIGPSLQHHVLDQVRRPEFVVADTMDLWLNIALPDLLKLLKRIDGFVLNDSEAHQLTKEDNVFSAHPEDSQARTEIRHHQERFPWCDSIRPARFLYLPGLSIEQSRGPHGRRRFLRGWHDGLSGDSQRFDRRQYPSRDGVRQRRGFVLLRGLWPAAHDAGNAYSG